MQVRIKNPYPLEIFPQADGSNYRFQLRRQACLPLEEQEAASLQWD